MRAARAQARARARISVARDGRNRARLQPLLAVQVWPAC